jgi:hypothetical protein
LVKGEIKENDFVMSKHRFEVMDENGIYTPWFYLPIDVEIEKVILINIGTYNNPNIVLGFEGGGACDQVLQKYYSIVEVSLINKVKV